MSRRTPLKSQRPSYSSRGRDYLKVAVRSMRAASRGPRPSQLAVLRGARGATEVKSVDNLNGQPNAIPFNTAGIVVSPLGSAATPTGGYPVEGAGFYNRIGRRIRMMSLQISGQIAPSTGNAAAVNEQFARVLVVYDRQPNGAFPSVADVLTNYDEAGGTSAAQPAFQHINMNNRDRFQILRDRKIILPPLGINGATPAAQTNIVVDANSSTGNKFLFEEFIRLNGAEMHSKASTGVIGDISTGSIFVLCVSSADSNATAAWTLYMTCRLKFLD